MLNSPPTIVEASGVVGAPIKFKWNGDIAMDLYDGVDNVRLFNAINASNVRARMAVACIVAEWIIWRLKGHVGIDDALARVEAAWAGVIHPAYAKDLDYSMSDDDTQPAEGALDLTLGILGEAWEEYAGDAIWVATHAMKLTYVARHVLPARKPFDEWLTEALRRLAESFPRRAEDDEDAEQYDHGTEQPVPRDFFEPSFRATPSAVERAIAEFLQGLRPKNNPYLRPPAELKAEGFKGKPYSA